MYNYNSESEADCNQLQNHYEIAIIQTQIKQERYFRKLWLFLIFILVVGSFYLLDKRPESLSINKALLALGITWLGFLPSLQYLSDRKRPPIPFFPLVGIFYATSFGLPIFSKDLKGSGRLPVDISEQALTLVLLGILGMNIAFYVSKSSLWQKLTPIQLPESYSRSKLLSLLWLLLASHLAFLYIPFVKEIPSLGQLLEPVGYVTYGMFYIIFSRGQLPTFQFWILLGVCVPLEIAKRLSSGLLAELMVLFLFMTILVWYERKRIPVIFITITVIFYLIFAPVKAEFRKLTWNQKFSHASSIEKSAIFIDMTINYYQRGLNSSQAQNHKNDSALVGRSAHIVVFSDVMRKTPTIVPYWGGETYLPLFTSFIPRALWPDKPIEIVGNRFGRRYRYLDRFDIITSFNLPWIVEMYVNFGTSGVLIGMSLVGLFLAFLDKKLNSQKMNSIEVVLGNTVLFGLIYQESNLSLSVGVLLNLTISLSLLFGFFLRDKPQH
ncbi:MAG: O-antigen polysaccharide polymerase Wzy [Stigonema ocellatum SAG 48.90 = DSM 106950]|nr:O-antigen polysaccharide polymerase Wzy [Stigonema ocellatum SAG 48.90 = DSM 106950]